jgi:hypothetical protein
MAACAVCGYETAVAFKFCPESGAPVRALDHQQRKVVTTSMLAGEVMAEILGAVPEMWDDLLDEVRACEKRGSRAR